MAGRLAHQLGDAKSVAILLERGVAMAGSPKMCAEATAKYMGLSENVGLIFPMK